MCPRCGCGPVDHGACFDLEAHHGDISDGTIIKQQNKP